MSLAIKPWRQCLIDVKNYPTAEAMGLRGEQATLYEKRKRAFEMKAQQRPNKEIAEETKLSPQMVLYYMKGTEEFDDRGEKLGHLALLRGTRNRQRPHKASADLLLSVKPLPYQLTAFFQKYDDIHQILWDAATRGCIPGSKEDGPELSNAVLYALFVEHAKKVMQAPYFPFNGEEGARVALARWVKKARSRYARGKAIDNARRRALNPWDLGLEPVARCYAEVIVDGHSIDVDWMIEAPALNGEGTVRTRVTRIWLIVAMERRSRAVLGWSVAFGANYSGADVARAVRNALIPWKPRQLSTTRIAYKEGDCLPSFYQELQYMCFDRFSLDNAKGHLSDYFLTTLERGINCVPVFGPMASPDVRALIEGLFALLEEAGFRNVRGQRGSHPKDKRKDDKAPDRLVLPFALLLDFIDLLNCRYNNAATEGSTTPRLEVLRNAVARGRQIYRRLPRALRDAYLKYDVFDSATIRRAKGKLVLRWKDARYAGPALDQHPEFVNEVVVVRANSQDSRQVELSLQRDGTPIGVVDIEPRWRATPHSLTTRRRAVKLRRQHSFIAMAADIALAMRYEAQDRARKGGRTARSDLARLLVEQGQAGDPNAAAPTTGPGEAMVAPLQPPQPASSAAPMPRPPEVLNAGSSKRRRRIAELGSATTAQR